MCAGIGTSSARPIAHHGSRSAGPHRVPAVGPAHRPPLIRRRGRFADSASRFGGPECAVATRSVLNNRLAAAQPRAGYSEQIAWQPRIPARRIARQNQQTGRAVESRAACEPARPQAHGADQPTGSRGEQSVARRTCRCRRTFEQPRGQIVTAKTIQARQPATPKPGAGKPGAGKPASSGRQQAIVTTRQVRPWKKRIERRLRGRPPGSPRPAPLKDKHPEQSSGCMAGKKKKAPDGAFFVGGLG